MAKKDLTGQKFGKLTVIKENPIRSKNGKIQWDCLCSCGNKTTVRGDHLRSGRTKSCGCQTTKKDLTGKRFGYLTVIEEDSSRSAAGSIKWKCICDCGNQVIVNGSSLRSGHTKSCGCLKKETSSQNGKNTVKDLTNMKFGKLTVLERDFSKTDKAGHTYWNCQCECGNKKSVSSTSLIEGNTISCGCLTQSKGEYIIENILKQNCFTFEKEKSFDSCKFPDSGRKARFDFYINNKYLIEFDGKQHFEYTGYDWNTKESFEKTQKHDIFKNQWCEKNNIPLIRIPHWHLNNLCIEDLKLETSNFIV